MRAPQNILLILSDDHGQWALGAAGNREIQTPTLDYLAATGVQFNNAFTPTPVCSPARACLITGRLASQHGIHDYLAGTDETIRQWPWLADEITLAQILSTAGYQTGLCGKWHLGDDDQPQPGFDNWFSLGNDYPVYHGGAHRYSDNGRPVVRTGYKTRIITERALHFLRERDTERPFFLMVGYTATHSPWEDHPERLVDAYRAGTFADIPRDVDYPFGRQNLESTFPTRHNRPEALAQYYAAVTQLDEATGQLVDELEALGLRDDTLVVYTSDHGLCCSHHGIWGKGNGTLPLNMVEESIRIPLLFNQPGLLFGGQRRQEFVDHLDTFQTLLAYAGLSPPERPDANYPGRSYLPALTNSEPARAWRQEQFGEYGPLRMIRTRRYKLIRRAPTGPHELFDLTADPRETENLFHDPAQEMVVRQLSNRLESYFARYEDPVKRGLNARNLPQHNFSEAWRTEG